MCDLIFHCNWILLFFIVWSLGGPLRDLTVVTSSGGALQRWLCVPASRLTSFTAVYILFVCMMMIPLGGFRMYIFDLQKYLQKGNWTVLYIFASLFFRFWHFTHKCTWTFMWCAWVCVPVCVWLGLRGALRLDWLFIYCKTSESHLFVPLIFKGFASRWWTRLELGPLFIQRVSLNTVLIRINEKPCCDDDEALCATSF